MSKLMRTWYARRPAAARFEDLQRIVMMQFFPGLGRTRFDKPVQPAGNAILACLWHRLEQRGNATLNTLPFRGFTAEVRGDGLHYGGSRGAEFVLDLMIKPGASNGKAVHPERQAGLMQRGLTMLKAANALRGDWQASPVPLFPEVLTVSASRPEFVVTPMLRRIAARRLNTTEAQLDAAPAVEQYLPMLFNEFVREPRSERNDTGSFLIPQVFTNSHSGVFIEDYTDLLGVETFNPAARLLNPSEHVLRNMKVTLTELQNETQGNRYEEYMRNFRSFLGDELQAIFTEDRIAEATLNPAEVLTAEDGRSVVEVLGNAAFLEAMRSNMTEDYRDLATDDELVAGIANPAGPLVLKGVCRPQAVITQAAGREDFASVNRWTPDVTETAVYADLWIDRLRPKVKRNEREMPVHAS